MTQVILTVVGSDRPGLTQRLADAVLAAGGNWLESSLATLGGKYVGAVLVEVPAERRGELEAAARAIDAAGLHVALVAAADAPPPAGTTLRLDLVGQDRPGIVREMAAAVAGAGVNIEDLSTAVTSGAESGERLFRATALLRLPAGVVEATVRDALEAMSAEIMVDLAAG